MKRIRNSTRHCQSSTPTVNGCDLTPLTRTQTSEQEYNDLTVSNRRLLTSYTRRKFPKALLEEPYRMIFRGRQNKRRHLWHITKTLDNLLVCENVVCSATARTKTVLGILQLLFNYLMTYLQTNLAYTVFQADLEGKFPRSLFISYSLPSSCVRG